MNPSAPSEWNAWGGSAAADANAADDRTYDPVDDTPVDSLPESAAIDAEDRDDEQAADAAAAAAGGGRAAKAEEAQLDGAATASAASKPSGDVAAAVPEAASSSGSGVVAADGRAVPGANDETVAASAKTTTAHSSKRPGSKIGRFIAASAARWVGMKSLRRVSTRVPDDCSGLVRLAYGRGGLDPLAWDGRPSDNAVTAMWRRAYRLGGLKKGSPKPGDLIFFRNTWDRNRDGKRNDGLTHVAIVESVAADGTVTFIHKSGQGVNRSRLNARYPHLKSIAGKSINEWLRRPDGTDGPRLTGELFAGYASVKTFRAESKRVARRTFVDAR